MTDRDQLLDAAEQLFYARGIQAVGMDAIRSASGVPLKRIYQLYGGKEELVVGFLRRRDQRWLASLRQHVDTHSDADARILAVFDWLHDWFATPDFRGCAWINAYGELGATSPAVADEVRAHKQAFADSLAGLVADAGRPAALARSLYLLAEGAIVAAAIHRSPDAAADARATAAALLATRN
ncbi:TetR/AcrR family transcriptional regulator [Cryptosporangium minutisporangium]|uniref:TetR/AcrR family transcriptional regulator n=1 Tax=Cryptosporangium minutisporangium TaxID=113569 RepID=A0ABP6SS85_9ACTN